MARPTHPDKDIERAVLYAETHGWRYDHSNGHAWGRLYCKGAARAACIMSVWSTPRDPTEHARQIRRRVAKCPH
jgi:hypothetical protein